MIKFIVRFSNPNKTPTVYQVDLLKKIVPTADIPAGHYYTPDPALYTYGSSLMEKIKGMFPWSLNNYRVYRQLNDSNCFDTKEQAILAIDRLLFENISAEIDEHNKSIQKINNRIEIIKNIKAKKPNFKKLFW